MKSTSRREFLKTTGAASFAPSVTPAEQATSEASPRHQRRTAPMKLEIGLVAPAEWRIEPDVIRIEAPARTIARQSVQIQIPRTWKPALPRFAVAADVVCDGKYLGQITEAVVEIGTAS